MKYRKRSSEVEAFQLTGGALQDRDSWPTWLLGALVDGWRVDSDYSLEISKTHWPITKNDYVTRDEHGDLAVVKPYTFEATYAEVAS